MKTTDVLDELRFEDILLGDDKVSKELAIVICDYFGIEVPIEYNTKICPKKREMYKEAFIESLLEELEYLAR